MKKAFAIVLLVVIVAASMSIMVACNNNKTLGANFEVPAGGYDGSEVTIKFYHTMGDTLNAVFKTYIAEFNKLYPNIHVEDSQIGKYDDVRDQINTELTAGNQPNIAYCYPDHVALYNVAGAVVQLDNLINSTETVTHADGTTEQLGLTQAQKDDFIEGFYNEGKSFGDEFMYTMPFSKSTEVLYYNKTFFDEYNATNDAKADTDATKTARLEVPTHWWCDSALGCDANCNKSIEKVARLLKKIDPNCIPFGYDSEANWFITLCEQIGSPYTSADENNHFLFNNDTNKSFINRLRGWYNDGLFTTQTILGSFTSGLFNTTTEKTRSYMSIGSSAGATKQRPAQDTNGNYPFEVGIASLPQQNPSRPKVISQGPSVCIFNKSNPQEVVASWLLVKYLTTTVAFQAEFADAQGYIPVLKSVSENPVFKKNMEKANGTTHIAYLSMKVCMEQANAYYTSPAFVGSSKARDEVGNLLVSCLDPSTNIDQAFAYAIGECEYVAS